jgi:hypothetical protein
VLLLSFFERLHPWILLSLLLFVLHVPVMFLSCHHFEGKETGMGLEIEHVACTCAHALTLSHSALAVACD